MSFSLDDLPTNPAAQPGAQPGQPPAQGQPVQQTPQTPPQEVINQPNAGTAQPVLQEPAGQPPAQPPANPGMAAPGIPQQANAGTTPPAAQPPAPPQQPAGQQGGRAPTLEEVQEKTISEVAQKYLTEIGTQLSPDWMSNWVPGVKNYMNAPDNKQKLNEMLDSADPQTAQNAKASLEQMETDAGNLLELIKAVHITTDQGTALPLDHHIKEYLIRPQEENLKVAREIRRRVMEPVETLKQTASGLILWIRNFKEARANAEKARQVEAQRLETERLNREAEETRRASQQANHPETAEKLQQKATQTDMEAAASQAKEQGIQAAPATPVETGRTGSGAAIGVRTVGVAKIVDPFAFLTALIADRDLFDAVMADSGVDFKATKIRTLLKKRGLKEFPGLGSEKKKSVKTG